MNKYTEEMKKFFEAYYEKMKGISTAIISHPCVPEDMWEDNQDTDEEWKVWKLIPSTVTEQMLGELEIEIGMKFPEVFKAFLSTYFYLFDGGIGKHTSEEPFESVRNAWNPMLVKAGYLPFAWDEEGYFIRCIKVGKEQNDLGVFQIDHELLFDFDEETVTTEEIDDAMQFMADDFMEYLDMLLQAEFDDDYDDYDEENDI